MTGDALRCDLSALADAAAALDALTREFRAAGDLADDARSAVGHGGLAGALEEFAGGWKVRRQDMVEDMQHLADMTHTAVTTYRDVDTQLAAAVDPGRGA